jgi:hypothetical protein
MKIKIMTDKEKARKIVEETEDFFYHNEQERGLACALRMAKWKNETMIEKACEWLKDMACIYAYWEYNGDTYEKEVVYDTEQLIKDFIKAMEE